MLLTNRHVPFITVQKMQDKQSFDDLWSSWGTERWNQPSRVSGFCLVF